MDEIKNDSSDLVSDAEEAAAEARRLVPQTLLHSTNTRNAGDGRGHGQRRSPGGDRRQVSEASPAVQSEATVCCEPGRELSLLLADGANNLCLI